MAVAVAAAAECIVLSVSVVNESVSLRLSGGGGWRAEDEGRS